MGFLQRLGQQPFQFAPPSPQGAMPQIAPPGGMPSQGPQNINELYSLYGVGPGAAFGAAPPQMVNPIEPSQTYAAMPGRR
jgi:hypothetical protein